MMIAEPKKNAASSFVVWISLLSIMQCASAKPFDWNGWYGGIAGGKGVGRVEQDDTTPFLSGPYNAGGGLLGATLGYNWKKGNVVPGIEGDFSYARIGGSTIGTNPYYGNCGASYCASEIRAIGTLRGRLGYEWNDILPYITAGVAYADVHGEEGTGGPGAFGSGSTWMTGWTVGAGIEGRLTSSWTFKGEYLYVDLGSKSVFTDNIGGTYYIEGLSVRSQIFRLGLNYHF
ncbi:MAG TPA: outer membrane beta-barrel protein [Burkholderiales bacterium]|nr:outer membrane beta-barrel protein [Burkholderiales bacterium]